MTECVSTAPRTQHDLLGQPKYGRLQHYIQLGQPKYGRLNWPFETVDLMPTVWPPGPSKSDFPDL